jgi:hypothetical protein
MIGMKMSTHDEIISNLLKYIRTEDSQCFIEDYIEYCRDLSKTLNVSRNNKILNQQKVVSHTHIIEQHGFVTIDQMYIKDKEVPVLKITNAGREYLQSAQLVENQTKTQIMRHSFALH